MSEQQEGRLTMADFNLLIEELVEAQTHGLPHDNLPVLAEEWDRMANATEEELALALTSDFKMPLADAKAFLALGPEWRQHVCKRVAEICRATYNSRAR